MIPLISDNLPQIAALCQRYGVRSLDLFGSAASGRFDPNTSDIDFICDLGGYEPGLADRFLDFANALEALLGRKVDLLTEAQIRNPYFRYAVSKQRVNIYESGGRHAAA